MSTTDLTAAILIVGNEILSGRTQDANTQHIASRLSQRGIILHEVRVVKDITAAVVSAINELRTKYKYVFTTGGIGPTHDDITAACIAEAFDTPLVINEDARKVMQAYYNEKGVEMNEGRLRMARIPVGSTLIDNPVSAAPGFKIGNVFVMAGVPNIMQAMFKHVETMLESGAPMLSKTVACKMREGDIALELEAIQKKYADIDIGSYPSMVAEGPTLSLVLRGMDEARLDIATEEVMALIRSKGDQPRAVG